jgi:Xaa-Pro aminopeptidase
MFSPSTYDRRRRRLFEADAPASGLVLLLGNEQSPMNYEDNPYPFRQDSTFLYYLGIDAPDLAAVLDLDSGSTCLYGTDPSLDDVIWMGERPSRADFAEAAGLSTTADGSALSTALSDALDAGRPIHFLPPYRPAQALRLASLLGLQPEQVKARASTPLCRTIVRHRSRKEPKEVEQLEAAVDTTARMHRHALRAACPGSTEREIAGAIAGLADAHGNGLSFRPTCSVHGEVLHNHEYGNTLQEGDLLLVDAGAASPLHYAGDITRVAPVGGSFSPRQRAVYDAVLDAQVSAIDALEPERPFREVHRHACTVLTEHLIDLGLMTGEASAAVAAGAHALFLPHGLGHMLGLDTHDMENLGEDLVGYAPDQTRSDQFGLHALRLARPLAPGFVVTVEPGCYFIPALIEQWKAEQRHAEFIDYDTVDDFVGLGGVRIEDDVLVTEDGARVLGPGIPKAPETVEELASTG